MKNYSMNVLSVFDGMSCFQIALNRCGIKYNKYWASEIDQFAIKIARKNYPNIIHFGDITKIRQHHFLHDVDFLVGGSPCQGFSFAGKGLNFDDPRSKLFFEFVRLKKELNPKWFLLENVKMKKEHEKVITDLMEVEPIMINSNLVSAQNRKRLYWTNIDVKEQPKDKGILLKDVLEKEVDDKYYLSNQAINRLIKNYQSKEWKSGNKMGNMKFPENINGKSKVITATQIEGSRETNHVYSLPKINPEKSGTLNTKNNSGQLSYDSGTVLISDRDVGRKPKIFANKVPPLRGHDGCSHDNKVLFGKNYVQWDTSGKGYDSQQDRAFYDDGKHGTLTVYSGENKCKVLTEGQIRILTPVECERLQTVPDNYTKGVSDSQRYKMLGNGFTIDVICHILSFLPK